MNKVFFIGAGPGDKELITLKAVRIIEKADIIIYAGSLVNKEVLTYSKNLNVEIYNSATMNLDEINQLIKESFERNKLIARLHTGDPSIYGAIFEQILFLEKNNIPYEIIPGVSSAFAAAAKLKNEFTLPEISQTVIFTRVEGKTPVPEKEKLSNIAKIGGTLILFLSVNQAEKIKQELLKGYYNENTPVIIAKKVSWEDEQIIKTNIKNMVEDIKNANITKTALILIGEVFDENLRDFSRITKSKLYDKNFKTEYRK